MRMQWIWLAGVLTAVILSNPVDASRDTTVVLPGGAQMEMIYIPPGAFLMGSPASEARAYDWEKPQHQVNIEKGFFLGKYVVTQGQWQTVMNATPWEGREYVKADPDHPAVFVSWEDAQAFIQKLNQAAGAERYRLPTEAEWEYACRAGTTTRWSFGDDPGKVGDYAWFVTNAWNADAKYAHKVGTKKPNPWGLYDVHGNVWEWCQDRWRLYPGGGESDPDDPHHVIRGGIFHSDAMDVRSANRQFASPTSRNYRLGFRLLMQVD